MSLVCRDIPEIASAYIDRDMPVRARVGVGLHLAVCRDCRAYVGGLRVVRRLAAESLGTGVPPALQAALGLSDPDTGSSSEDRT